MRAPQVLNRQRKYPIAVDRLERFALRLRHRLGVPALEFTVVLTSDLTVRRLNRLFRGKNEATDVLSFPAKSSEPSWAHLENHSLGDIIISVETAQQQAFDQKHPLEIEIQILMIHGLLHLLGYDHETDQGQMRRKELRLQKELL